MSKNTYAQINYSAESIEINHWNNSDDAFKKPLHVFRNNNILLSYPPVDKNGFSGENNKSQAKKVNQIESKSDVKIPKILTIPKRTNYIFCQNDKQSLLNDNTTSFQTKYLELRNNNFSGLGDFSNIPDLEKHLYNVNMYFNLNEQHFLLNPLISKVNNDINSN